MLTDGLLLDVLGGLEVDGHLVDAVDEVERADLGNWSWMADTSISVKRANAATDPEMSATTINRAWPDGDT